MEWLQDLENLVNDLVDMVYYSKVFAFAVCAAFLIIFIGLVIINSKLRTALSDHEVLQEELREIKAIIKGETGNGTNDERGDEGDYSSS